ncbi:Late Golgi vesicles protein [Orbilia oligospora]|uniref:Late Golgi vesicles protein n=1 Tax=Orbilia oligospora TaxID=2813651 RepID=A0A7C8PSH5_ORBOL|nr:Late Golgi vesicles protein [Orbilia oligospora]KAF3096740.1 Late Golgi vesicles protein [Orbilia oligospora]KAF3120039.1 Late Golgi vesicles protein [Orbilia oligospora]KAF3148233.1 Late Golgi vesicles protein [Orbilia oligospora]KAF3177933.1 Late Golgi vesicles protein [Orbilia oligospora]
MDLGQAFRLANLAVGGLMVFGGIAQFFDLTLQHVILGVYIIVFGAATALLEFQIPPPVSRYANFMFSFIGRGAFYIFTGSILYHKAWYSWIPGSLIVLVGIGYIGLEFVPSIEPPENMREGGYDGLGETV